MTYKSKTWLNKKVNHYLKTGNKDIAIRFIEKYGPEIPDYNGPLEIKKIIENTNKTKKQDKKVQINKKDSKKEKEGDD